MASLKPKERKRVRDAAFTIFNYEPHKAQQTIHDSTARFKAVVCGRRSGKSKLSAMEICELLFNPAFPGQRIWIVAPHFDTTKFVFREVWAVMKKHIPSSALIEARFTDQKRIIRTIWGSELLCKSGDNLDALDGEELDLLVMDEAAKTKFIAWNQHLRPTMSSRKGRVIFITTPEGKNWIHDLYKKGNDPKSTNWQSFTFTSASNPHGSVREDMEDARTEMTPETFQQEYLAAFVSRSGLVYKSFSFAKHVISVSQLPKEFDEVIVGIDYGFINPSAFLLIGIKDKRYYVIDEHYEKEMFDIDRKAVLQSFREKNWYRYCYADHDAEANAKLRLWKFPMRKAEKDVAGGIEKVSQKMMIKKDGKPSLFIVNTCTDLITELEGYSYHEPKDSKNDIEEPIKLDDHACDALRYAIFTHEKPKKKVKTSTPKGSLIYG